MAAPLASSTQLLHPQGAESGVGDAATTSAALAPALTFIA